MNAQLKPQPLGKVTVSTPGTPVALVSALVSAGIVASGEAVGVNKIDVTALSTNTGKVYLGTATMNKTTLAGVIAILAANGNWKIQDNVGVNKYRADLIYVDADNGGEGLWGSIDQE